MYVSLIQNATLLIAIIASYELLGRISREKSVSRYLLIGFLFGITAVMGMLMPFHYQPGIIYDGRSIILTLAGLFGSRVTTLIAISISSAFRILKGGAGVYAGVATIICCAGVGALFRRIYHRNLMNISLPMLYGIGIVTHLVMLACQLLIMPIPSGSAIVRRIWLPIMLIFPPTFAGAARLLQNLERHLKNADELKKWESIFRYAGWSVIIVESKENTITAYNPAISTMFGYSETEIRGKRLTDICGHETQKNLDQCFEKAEKEGSCRFEGIFLRKDGSTFPADVEVMAHRDAHGRTLFYALNIRDITERKEAEAQILHRNELLNALLQISRKLASTLELPQVLKTATDSALEFLGLQSTAVYLLEDGRLHLAATSPPLPKDFPEDLRYVPLDEHPHIKQALQNGSPLLLPDAAQAELTIAEKQVCELRNLRTLLYLPLLSPQETLGILIVGSVGVPIKIDETQIDVCQTLAYYISLSIINARLYESIKRHAEELEAAVVRRTAELEAKNRELEAFSYSISHDLRAPLRAVKGFAEIILRRHRASLNDEAMHYFDNILESAEYMGQLIGDLLNYSRLGRGGVSLKSFSLAELAADLAQEFAPSFDKVGARLVIQPDLPAVYAEPILLRQALTNLIDNALKYRRENVIAEVVLTAARADQWIEIRVSDNGIGIAPEFHEKIFEIFQRLHSRDRYGGTGIGLAMVKKAVGMMGGTISVESVPEQGSTFIIRLPAA
ncbi:MAG: ATP-binding protein [candidate division KSB1 bacterium]|nr:ATP-binding protein [candidate division KSB1 bacterium]